MKALTPSQITNALWKARGVYRYCAPLADRLAAYRHCVALNNLRDRISTPLPRGRGALMIPLHPDDMPHAEAFGKTLDIKRLRAERKKRLTQKTSTT